MESRLNVCGRRITYDYSDIDAVPDDETVRYGSVLSDIEDIVAIITEMQNGRMNEAGEITEPLTPGQVRTLLEVLPDLDRSLAFFDVLDDHTEEEEWW